jgi:hypothetical protein
MRGALLLMLCVGCASDDERGMPILLAEIEGRPTVVGTYEAGVLALDDEFVSSFEMPAVVEEPAKPLARGDLLHLVLSTDGGIVDEIPLVAGDTSTLLAPALATCAWQFRTVTFRSACAASARHVTMEYWKRCASATWQRYGGTTWSEGC